MIEVNKDLSEACFDEYLRLVHKLTGITIRRNRKTMLSGRVRKRITKLGIDNFVEYLSYVKENRKEEEFFINVMTTNETYFYRTPRIWDFIANNFLANWKLSTRLNVWSAASSTGEEAHTLGILCERFKSIKNDFEYRIIGTDISTEVVRKANDGVYKGRSIERFRQTCPELFQKYMSGDDTNGYKVLPKIKKNIHFKYHNLFNSFPAGEKFDLILLRNVLIYFTPEDQEKVLFNIHKCLRPDGILVIGESETLSRLDTRFEHVAPLIYKLKAGYNDKDLS